MKYNKIKELVKVNNENIDRQFNKEKIYYLDTSNITRGKIGNIVEINTENAPSRAKRIVRKNDIIYSTVRPNLCHYGLLRSIPNDLIVSTGFVVLRCDEKQILPEYLYAYLTLPQITKKMNSIAETSTSTYPSIKPSDLGELIIPVPEINQQQKIANILFCLDKKIELNNQINNNLLEIIQRIIKERFYNDKLELVSISNFGKIQGGYAFKSNDLLDEKTKNRIVKIKNITTSNVDLENTQYILDNVAKNVDKKFQLYNGNVIIAMTGAELGKTGFIYGTNDKYFLNQRVGVVRGNSNIEELYLNQIFLLDSFQKMLNSKGYGSAQPNISTSDIESIEIPNPSIDELNEFYKIVNPMYNLMIENSIENMNLEQLRDTLLPKLMNGEIDLENIEI